MSVEDGRMAVLDRWSAYTDLTPSVAHGWALETVTPPSRLGGSNGITVGPDGRLYVTQVFFSQVTAIDVDTGEHEVFSPLGSGIRGPDDGIFGADGTFYATEPMFGRVSARDADGTYRVVADDLPAANGVTMDAARQRLFVDEFRPGGRLMELDPTGKEPPRIFLEDLAGPNAPAVGPDGRLWFPQVFADQVWWYDLDTGESRLAVDDLARPTAIKFDSQGRLVVSEAAAGRITAVDITTGERTTLAEVPLGIDNLALSPDDRLFVAHYVDGRVAEETGGRTACCPSPVCSARTVWPSTPTARSCSPTASAPVRCAPAWPSATSASSSTCRRWPSASRRSVAGRRCSGRRARSCCTPVANRPCSSPDWRIPRACAPTATVCWSPSAAAAVWSRVDAAGTVTPLVDGLPSAAAVDVVSGGFVVSAGTTVVFVDAHGERRTIDGFADAQGVAVAGEQVLVADAGRHELVAVNLVDGRREMIVSGAPIGLPVEGIVPAAFTPLAPDGAGGVLVGCNGDGSIRRLTRV